jgi:hypothetical protein
MSVLPLTTKQKIDKLLDDLPPSSLTVVERFVEFVHDQAQRGQVIAPTPQTAGEHMPPYLYPTVDLPASSLDAWMNLLPEGCGGDALADTEALYDEG